MKLEAIRKLTEAATPGPWSWRDNQLMSQYDEREEQCIVVTEVYKEDDTDTTPADATFIAASRELLPKLVKAWESLELIAEHSCQCNEERGFRCWAHEALVALEAD